MPIRKGKGSVWDTKADAIMIMTSLDGVADDPMFGELHSYEAGYYNHICYEYSPQGYGALWPIPASPPYYYIMCLATRDKQQDKISPHLIEMGMERLVYMWKDLGIKSLAVKLPARSRAKKYIEPYLKQLPGDIIVYGELQQDTDRGSNAVRDSKAE